MFILLAIAVISNCIKLNFDSDSYFIINTGKYIIENKSIPTINIWTIHEDFKIVIQQWLCCVENCIAYNLANRIGIAIITIFHALILNILLIKFISLYTKNKRITLIVLYISNYIVHAFMSARPSLITMSILTYELIQLELWGRSSKDRKSNIKLLINLALISIFQINYHSALWLMDIMFILPYMVPAIWDIDIYNIKESLSKQKKELGMLFASIATIIISAFLNPNGIEAIRYLDNSRGIINDSIILELETVKITDTYSLIIISLIVLFAIYIIKWNGRNKSLIYLTCGTIILSMQHMRNFWLILFSLIQLLIILLEKIDFQKFRKPILKRKHTIIPIIFIAACSYTLLSKPVSCLGQEVDYKRAPIEAVNYLDSLPESDKENLVIYNEFGNGAYLQFHGYKTYIDARPELYMKSINGKEDIYQEWIDLRDGAIDFNSFIEKYNFNTFIVYNRTLFDCYLHYNNNYEKVVQGTGYKVYRLK